MERRGSRWRLVWAGLAGAVVAASGTGFVMGGSALAEAGGGCGSAARPCPPGMPAMLATGMVGVVVAIVLFTVVFLSDGPKKGRLVTTVLCFALALPVSRLGFDRLQGPPPVSPAWSAPADRPTLTKALAVWQDGETVVRVRADRFDAYRARTGESAWTLEAPPRKSVCAASAAVDGLAAVGYGTDPAACDRLAAVDLRTGRELWHKDGVRLSALELAGPATLVARGDGQLAAFGLRDGAPAWTAAPTPGCAFGGLSASAVRVVAAEYCATADPAARTGATWLRAFGPAGEALWRTDTGAASEPTALAVLAADPPVVRLTERGNRGIDAVLSFAAADGAPRATIPVSSADYELTPLRKLYAPFQLRPVRPAAVVGDLFVAAAGRPGDRDSSFVVAHSLADGSRAWARKPGGKVLAVAAAPDGPLVVTERGHNLNSVHRLDGTDGRTVERTDLRRAFLHTTPWLGRTDDRYVFVNEDGTTYSRPAVGAPRR
ncbi:PQQ-like domain-containing protein [Streptomyces sp. TLI_053]|uniref:outer membrane protein assembly factor BamB family protein n=1 Tax=Streptomyces sp. TLI_053 TaxID=1855352 RepID=UPI00087B1975|nr:PQQ-binding-like beta-propeller repeat protein [Streptomyces sp. TLI_053]SDT47784.1 PQQ-like domain-containing protein [Streptomyces sp. TLI_053]